MSLACATLNEGSSNSEAAGVEQHTGPMTGTQLEEAARQRSPELWKIPVLIAASSSWREAEEWEAEEWRRHLRRGRGDGSWSNSTTAETSPPPPSSSAADAPKSQEMTPNIVGKAVAGPKSAFGSPEAAEAPISRRSSGSTVSPATVSFQQGSPLSAGRAARPRGSSPPSVPEAFSVSRDNSTVAPAAAPPPAAASAAGAASPSKAAVQSAGTVSFLRVQDASDAKNVSSLQRAVDVGKPADPPASDGSAEAAHERTKHELVRRLYAAAGCGLRVSSGHNGLRFDDCATKLVALAWGIRRPSETSLTAATPEAAALDAFLDSAAALADAMRSGLPKDSKWEKKATGTCERHAEFVRRAELMYEASRAAAAAGRAVSASDGVLAAAVLTPLPPAATAATAATPSATAGGGSGRPSAPSGTSHEEQSLHAKSAPVGLSPRRIIGSPVSLAAPIQLALPLVGAAKEEQSDGGSSTRPLRESERDHVPKPSPGFSAPVGNSPGGSSAFDAASPDRQHLQNTFEDRVRAAAAVMPLDVNPPQQQQEQEQQRRRRQREQGGAASEELDELWSTIVRSHKSASFWLTFGLGELRQAHAAAIAADERADLLADRCSGLEERLAKLEADARRAPSRGRAVGRMRAKRSRFPSDKAAAEASVGYGPSSLARRFGVAAERAVGAYHWVVVDAFVFLACILAAAQIEWYLWSDAEAEGS